jgi:two-component system LytT family response regulator
MPFGSNDFVYVADSAKGWVVRASEICTVETCGNYTQITLHTGDKLLIRRAFKRCEQKLDPMMFFRANRQCIVNLNYVRQTRMLDAKRILFVLANGREIPLSRNHSLLLKRNMSL